jgi:acetyl/propionyl-CoA carboxylase alpha subunit
MQHRFLFGDEPLTFEVVDLMNGLELRLGDQRHVLSDLQMAPGRVEFMLDDERHQLDLVRQHDDLWIAYRGRTYHLTTVARSRSQGDSAADEGILRAPMPGQVRALEASPGEHVVKGQTVILLEAMKLEIKIQAPADGVIAALDVQAGDHIQKGQILGRITPEAVE